MEEFGIRTMVIQTGKILATYITDKRLSSLKYKELLISKNTTNNLIEKWAQI